LQAEKLPQVASPLTFATEAEIRAVVNAGPGSLGPVFHFVQFMIATHQQGNQRVSAAFGGFHQQRFHGFFDKLPQVASPLTFATEAEIRAVVNAGPGSLGPVNMPLLGSLRRDPS
jgi:hypothetical protein